MTDAEKTASDAAARIVSDHWAIDRSNALVSWLQHPVCLEAVNRRISGDPDVSIAAYYRDRYAPTPFERCLVLGCGHGHFERGGIESGLGLHFDACDLSEGAIARAREQAVADGHADKITYSVVDLNVATLPPATYDAIFAPSSAHHVFNLEHFYRQCRSALKPGGLFFLNEYIGPSRFQTPPHVVALINDIRRTWPERYRYNLFTNDGSLIGDYVPSPPEHFEKYDPSEAVRSGELVNALKLYFDIVDLRSYGGALQQMLFHGVAGNFDRTNESDVAMLRTIALLEEALEQAGTLQSDHAVIVAKPKNK